MESTNKNTAPASDLCHNCRAFYGSKDRDYLCSSCWKDKKAEQVSPVPETATLPEIKLPVSLPEVEMKLATNEVVQEEKKDVTTQADNAEQSQPVQVSD
jgi:hypothetical protein